MKKPHCYYFLKYDVLWKYWCFGPGTLSRDDGRNVGLYIHHKNHNTPKTIPYRAQVMIEDMMGKDVEQCCGSSEIIYIG